MDDRQKGNHPHGGPPGNSEEWRRDLASSLRRVNEQLAHNKWPMLDPEMKRMGEQIARGVAQEALSHVSDALDRAGDRRQANIERKIQRKLERARLKEERRTQRFRQRMDSTSMPEGFVWILISMAMIAAALLQHDLWWMVFPALPFGLRGARIIGYHRNSPALPAPKGKEQRAATERVEDPRAVRIDEVCDRLLAALKDAPKALREFLSTPEQTVDALRKTSHDLLRREVALRALTSPEEMARLDRERLELQARIAAESDNVVRTRLTGAVAALDNQQQQHVEVARSANRLDAERTRLGYTLDSLYAQVMRVRTADSGAEDVVQAGLRQSLDQLRKEMNALADAVEETSAPTSVPEDFSGASAQRTRVR